MNDLIVIEQQPRIPLDWNCKDSIGKVKQIFYKWAHLTYELACELWIAREILSKEGRPKTGAFAPVFTWADYCRAIGINKSTANRWLARIFQRQPDNTITETPQLPPGQYEVIVIDPPWPYGTVYNAETRRVASPYPEMNLDELGALQIPAATDCILWLWTTNAFMHDAHHILEAWDFEPKTILTWFKEKTGVGYWLRGQTEHCILAVKGEPQLTHKAQGTALFAKARRHSEKPDEFYQFVESLCPGRKLDMFARRKRQGWEVWGNEI